MRCSLLLLALVAAVAVNAERVCEHQNMKLECPEGQHIKVFLALYGRKKSGVCKGAKHDKTSNCAATNSLEVVKEQCEGKQSCDMKASNGVFGDPCVGTFKYLEVAYKCVRSSRESRVCEHQNMKLECPEGRRIIVKSALYGRKKSGYCKGARHDTTSNCAATTSLGVVKEQCEGKQICDVKASNGVFGDPCVGTFKYLEVAYRCGRASRVCEHQNMKLTCPEGQQIVVRSALYGRKLPDVCKGAKHDKTSNCAATTSLGVVEEQCEGKQSCDVKASNGVFGDPCVGTFKYLDVTYKCVRAIRVCEHQNMKLKCPEGQQIIVKKALYGRKVSGVCKGAKHDITSNCAATSSLGVLKEQCEGKQSCDVKASNGVFGDPCVGTFKYLEVAYKCGRADRVCEHQKMKLECPEGQQIRVDSALYGRKISDVCKGAKHDVTSNCAATNSLEVVTEQCEGKQSCEVKASNGVFGDPCVGTFKYLEVAFNCQ